MRLSWQPFQLEFKYPFGVSGNTRTHTPVVFTKLSYEGISGYGEASMPPYLGGTQESVISFLKKAELFLQHIKDPFQAEEILAQIDSLAENNNAAKAAIDIALHDLVGKLKKIPAHKIFGIDRVEPRATACTIGIGDETLIEKKIKEASEFTVLKIKLGTGNDKQIVETIRKYTDKPLYVDVNQGWNDTGFVIEMIHWLKEKNVLLVEQPMPVSSLNEMRSVKERSSLPLIGDESVKRLSDIEKNSEAFHGINIKLMKSTGLHEAMKMISFARKNNLRIYLGCMGESSCASTAMAHLMPMADYIDLDAPFLIKNDPFTGLKYEKGKVLIGNSYGTSVSPLSIQI